MNKENRLTKIRLNRAIRKWNKRINKINATAKKYLREEPVIDIEVFNELDI